MSLLLALTGSTPAPASVPAPQRGPVAESGVWEVLPPAARMAPIIAALAVFIPCARSSAAQAFEATDAQAIRSPVRIAPLAPLPPFIPRPARAGALDVDLPDPPRALARGAATTPLFTPARRAAVVAEEQSDPSRASAKIAAFIGAPTPPPQRRFPPEIEELVPPRAIGVAPLVSAVVVAAFVPYERPIPPADGDEPSARALARSAALIPLPPFIPARRPGALPDAEAEPARAPPRAAALVAPHGPFSRRCAPAEEDLFPSPARARAIAAFIPLPAFAPGPRPRPPAEPDAWEIQVRPARIAPLASTTTSTVAFIPPGRTGPASEPTPDLPRPPARIAPFAIPPAFVPPRPRQPLQEPIAEDPHAPPEGAALSVAMFIPPAARRSALVDDTAALGTRVTFAAAAFAPSQSPFVPGARRAQPAEAAQEISRRAPSVASFALPPFSFRRGSRPIEELPVDPIRWPAKSAPWSPTFIPAVIHVATVGAGPTLSGSRGTSATAAPTTGPQTTAGEGLSGGATTAKLLP